MSGDRSAGAAAIDDLKRRQEAFLTETLPDALRSVNLEETAAEIPVEVMAERDVFGRNYELTVGGRTYDFWFGLNVFRIFSIYFVPIDLENPAFRAGRSSCGQSDFIAWLRDEVFEFTFGGAEKIGYSVNFEVVEVDAKRFVSIWAVVVCDSDFLDRPELMLFWAQDLAMMTESFIRNAVRADLKFDAEVSPRPV